MALCLAAPAFGDPLAVKQAEADRVQKQIESLGTKVEIAAENYNKARIRLNDITDQVGVVQRKINKLQKHQLFLQGHLDTRVSEMYRTGPLDFLTVLLSVRSFEDFDSTIRVLTSLNNQDAATVSDLKDTKASAQESKNKLVSIQKQARVQKVAMAENEAEIRQQLSNRKRLLAGLDSQIQKLLAAAMASQGTEQQARTMAGLLRTRSASTGGITFGGDQAPNPKAAAAVYWAESQMGKPYVWAAAGPDTYDCSGLMLWSYGHVGITLNHYSGDQINEGKSVQRSDLRPGDLVFFGSPIHHVGMYVGGDNFIEAPYTGSVVRIARFSNRGDFAGACRPSE